MQAAGQIADLGGGALMAAFGILAALRERERSGEGQLVDVSMADGALSLAGDGRGALLRRRRACRARGELELAGGLACYRPYALRRRLGHARRAGAEVLAGVLPRASAARTSSSASSTAGPARTRELEAIFAARTRAEWAAFAAEHDCCLEPVLDLDEALDSELVRAREMVVELDQPGAAAPVRLLGAAGQALAHAGRRHAARPGARRATPTRCSPRLGYDAEDDRAAEGGGRRRRARRACRRGASWHERAAGL